MVAPLTPEEFKRLQHGKAVIEAPTHRIDWIHTLGNLLQVIAFCVVLATLQYAFMPDRAFARALTYSLLIGGITWALIDLGRHFFPSSAETGWPQGWASLGLVLAAIIIGYLAGSFFAGALSIYYGWHHPGAGGSSSSHLRTSLLITMLSGTVAAFFFYSRNKSAYLNRKMTEARAHASEARLKLLQSQLEPHMLFNTLANLRALIGTDPERATAMLDCLNNYLRATLSGSLASTHTLQAEFDRLRDYLELMAVRMGPRLGYTLELPPELAKQSVPTLLLQPLVENSIKHGLEPRVEGGNITVSARREGDFLVLEVADTGVGVSGTNENGSGFGVAQVRERLANTYGASSALKLEATSTGGMRAAARIPITP